MTIGEVSAKFGVSEDTLRFYEKAGLIPPVPKAGGKRDYGEKELNGIEFVMCMRGAGLSIEVLKEYIDLSKQGDSTAEQRRNLLIRERDALKKKLDDMNKAYERLNYKIEVYYPYILNREKVLLKGEKWKNQKFTSQKKSHQKA